MAATIKTVTNNAIRDPLSGFDVDVYVQDQATGAQLIVGRFTSFQYTIRNATEPYMEFNQRVARLLDGEMQFGFVLERGLIDVRDPLRNSFGLSYIGREIRLSRSPRMQITVLYNAKELDEESSGAPAPENTLDILVSGSSGNQQQNNTIRRAKGGYQLTWAKFDSMTVGHMAGRSVVASRWEGLCEGFRELQPSEVIGTAGAAFDAVAGGTEALNTITGINIPENNGVPDWSGLFA